MKKIVLYEKNHFLKYRKEEEEKGVVFYSMSDFLSTQIIDEIDEDYQYKVDISSLVAMVKKDDAQTLHSESLLNHFKDNVTFICDKAYENEVLYLFRYVFDEILTAEIKEDEESESIQKEPIIKNKITKIIDLNEIELEKFFSIFESRLYGHNQFKSEFRELVESFRVFNKLGEHKILSLFLMGDSGVGKTEVARSIHTALESTNKLAKINFGNYSSHDALNSLIGSPLGYIGSDGGELIKRVKNSDIGLILIDEFEKANTAVFNYFLDVLENGKIVNSQAEELDVNGYIIVFTSNMTKEEFKKKISPELRSRFDYKGVFNLLTNEDKQKFVHFRVNQIIEKYKEYVSGELSAKVHENIVKRINVSQYTNMRDLNKKIKDVFVDEIKNRHELEIENWVKLSLRRSPHARHYYRRYRWFEI